MTNLHLPYDLRAAVTLRGMSGIIAGIALNDKDEMFYIFRDGMGRAFHAFHHELSLS